MKEKILKEIIPLTHGDCYTIFSRQKSEFDFPLHYHDEFELNFIQNARGATRIVGDHVGEIGDTELVLVGSNIQHAWFNGHCQGGDIREITIQFHRDLFDERFLRRNQLGFLRTLLEKSMRGILFSTETTQKLAPRLINLTQQHGFDGVLELMSILHDLSISRNMRLLSTSTFNPQEPVSYNSRRIEKVMEYMNQNFEKSIALSDVARLANMTDAAFSRFFKTKTGNGFIDSLTEIRLGHAARLLIDTNQSVSEIAYHCGFNNMSNFNRIFKKKKSCTPREFRENLAGKRTFV